MKKLWICVLSGALTAGVSMGGITCKFLNGTGDGLWETPENWSTGALPGIDDDVFKSNEGNPTCTCSSSNTVNALRINEGQTGGVTLIMTNAWLTLRSNTWASVSYNVRGGPSTLIMYNSTIRHNGGANGHFNVGYCNTNDAYEMTSTLIMDNSKIILLGTFRMHQATPLVTTLAEEFSNITGEMVTTTVTLNNQPSP